MRAPVAARISSMRALDVPGWNCTRTSPGATCSPDGIGGGKDVLEGEFGAHEPTPITPTIISGMAQIDAGILKTDIDTGSPSRQRGP
jgi:hypothetical protein